MPERCSDVALYALGVSEVKPPEPVRVPSCVVCRATEAEVTYRVEGVAEPIVVCVGCRLGYYHPLPTMETVAGFYEAAYYGESGIKFRSGIERLVRFFARRQARQLTRGLAPGSRVLDVGCGRGVLASALADLGFRAHGFEITNDAVRQLDPRVELCVAPELAAAGLTSASFDAVIVWHVLEHLRNPKETLLECRRLLRPGGRLVVATPNFTSAQARWSGPNWFHLDPPRHLFHFPADALRRLLEQTGFTCGATHHFSLVQNPFGWIQSAMNRAGRWPRNALYDAMYRKRSEGTFGLVELELMALLFVAMPAALVASAVAAVLDQGATLHIVAHRSG